MEPVTYAAAHDKPDNNDDDDVAIPTPIATLVFQDGRIEPVYKPLAGHEHLFKARPMVKAQTSFSSRASSIHRPILAAPTQVPGKWLMHRAVPHRQLAYTLPQVPPSIHHESHVERLSYRSRLLPGNRKNLLLRNRDY